MPAVSADLSKRLVPDELWELVAPLLPSFTARPQGGGTAPRDERAVFTAAVYVLTSGCAWRHLPPTFGTASATAHRRFTVWIEVGLWRRLHRAVLDELGVRGEVDWTSAIVDAASVRAKKGRSLTGPNPVDRGKKKGSKLHVLADAQDIPLAVAVSGANMHDSFALKPLILGTPAVGPAGDHGGAARQTPCGQGVLLRRTPQLAARAWARRAHRATRHRVRRTPWAAPLEDRAVDRLALRQPPPDHPIRTKGLALPRLPRPGRCPDLLQEARETCHVRRPL